MPLQLNLNVRGFDALDKSLGNLSAGLHDLTPAMHAVGQNLLDDIHRGFANAGEPNGRPWAPLKPATWARKKTKTPMKESGALLNSIKSYPTSMGVVVGTELDYGGHHQTGYRNGGKSVPARPIVGFSTGALESAAQTLLHHINRLA